MSEQTKNDIIDGMASEIADMTMNGASDEELKEAIDYSKDIIDNLKTDIIDSLKVDFRNLYSTNTATFRAEFARNGWMDHICSNCGYTVNDDVHVQYDWNYCPNCGAKFIKGSAKNDEEKSFEEAADELIKKCF